MKTIYLHIGVHKTGTTHLQRILLENQPKLQARGYYYPKTGIPSFIFGHHKVAWAVKHGDYIERPFEGVVIDLKGVWEGLIDEIESIDSDHIIISCEYFCLYSQEYIRELKKRLDKYHIKVILCIRKQTDFLKSLYSENVKTGCGESFQNFFHTRKFRCDYAAILRDWESEIGAENIAVQRYSKHCLLKDFFCNVGLADLEIDDLKVSSSKTNVSLSGQLLKALRWMNALCLNVLGIPYAPYRKFLLKPFQGQKTSKLFSKIPSFLLDDEIVTPEVAKAIMDEFAACNEEVASKYFPELQGSLFGDT
ncbi:MAG: hypothetical protein ACFBSG_11460 [Leptolyngbyaceae cyanobacterium]